MPDCLECRWRDGDRCTMMPEEWPATPINFVRACVIGISKGYEELISSGARVLEIGCGSWSPMREHCLQVGARWDGIDIVKEYDGKPSIATRYESVEFLSFPDESFDFVIANQSLEHWDEYGCRIERGLWQCFRVCKVGGKVLMNVPIHNHGAEMFVEGDLEAIQEVFERYSSSVELIPWRKNSEPFEKVDLLPGYSFEGKQNAYLLDIQAVRAETLSPPPDPYRIRSRLFREIWDHKIQYSLWRAKRKIKAKLGRS